MIQIVFVFVFVFVVIVEVVVFVDVDVVSVLNVIGVGVVQFGGTRSIGVLVGLAGGFRIGLVGFAIDVVRRRGCRRPSP